MLRFSVLGPVRAYRNGNLIDLGARKQKSVIAVLIAETGALVDVDRIIGCVWGEDASASRKRSVQTYVSALRQVLNADGHEVIRSDRRGYRLTDDGVEIDWREFERAFASGSNDDYRTALDLWDGRPFEDVENDWARPLITSWEEKRLTALELWSSAQVDDGRAPAVLGDLERASLANPMRESLAGVLMHAQAAAGRPADALATYQRLRSHLIEEMGIEPSPELRELEERILLEEHGAQHRSYRSALPPERTPLIGREGELDAVSDLLRASPLVSLLGPGGSGKTRLAIAAARRFGDESQTPTFFVDLTRLSDSDQVARTIAETLGVNLRSDEDAGMSILDQVAHTISTKQLLVVVDNCEHVIDGARRSINSLLGAGPAVGVLATSREALETEGEVRFQVPPLVVGEDTGSPALKLLLTRAEAVHPGFSPTEEDTDLLRRVCESLDGMPLAIELAAAQLTFLSASDLLEGLSERLSMSGGSGRQTRHRSLQATMDWSWDLLDDEERVLLAEVSIFAGGWTLAAAQGICTGSPSAIRDLLGSLVAKSLVVAESNLWGARYRLLETVRMFAMEQITGSLDDLRWRHASWYQQWCESFDIEEHWASGELASRLLHDSDNLEAALGTLVDHGGLSGAVSIVSAHLTLWRATHASRQSMDWTGAIDTSELNPEELSRWLIARAAALQVSDRFPEMWRHADHAAEIAEEISRSDLHAVALATSAFGYLTLDVDSNQAKWEEVLALTKSTPTPRIEGTAWAMLAIGALLRGEDPETYRPMFERAAPLVGANGWDRAIYSLGESLMFLAAGEARKALREQLRLVEETERLGITLEAARYRLGLADAAAHAGEREILVESLSAASSIFQMAWGMRAAADVVLGFAAWEVFNGDPYVASELLAVVRHDHLEYEESVVRYVRTRDALLGLDLESERLEAARSRGAETPIADALAACLSSD
jgi:predicted ATPase/DNA-binding winged helix-turn-helix (wHTH) protein